MYRSTKRGYGKFIGVDGWKEYEGVYPTPTRHEYQMIVPFLPKFAFEDDDFNEDEDEEFVRAKEGFPQLRALLMEFLRQIRESKGYDVTFNLESFVRSPFYPRPTDEGKEAAWFAIAEINRRMMPSGKAYKYLNLEKFVLANLCTSLLTIRAKEIDANAMEIDDDDDDDDDDVDANDDNAVKIIQAMVYEPFPDPFELIEWKFKPGSIA